jgi:hypothetical protein
MDKGDVDRNGDILAPEDAVHFIVGRQMPWDEDEFLEKGTRLKVVYQERAC